MSREAKRKKRAATPDEVGQRTGGILAGY